MKSRFFMISITFLALFCFIKTNAVAESPVTASLRAAGGAVGGSGYVVLTGMNKTVKETYPKIYLTVVPGGFVGNLDRVNIKESDLATTANALCFLAEKQKAPIDKPLPNLRSLVSIQDKVVNGLIVRKDLPVNSMGELLEKKFPIRISALSKGSVGELILRTALSYKNVTYDDIEKWGGEVNHVGWSDGVNLVKDGHADGIFSGYIKGQGWVMELTRAREMKFLEWEDDFLEFMYENLGLPKNTLEGGMFEGIKDDFTGPTWTTQVVINADVKDEIAYALVRGLDENAQKLRSYHSCLENFVGKGMSENLYLPIHDGARKYYKENGYIK